MMDAEKLAVEMPVFPKIGIYLLKLSCVVLKLVKG
jgi:hypothetical protein